MSTRCGCWAVEQAVVCVHVCVGVCMYRYVCGQACVCVCGQACVCVWTCVCTMCACYVCAYTRVHSSVCARAHVCVERTCTCVCAYACVHEHVCVQVHACVYSSYICIDVNTAFVSEMGINLTMESMLKQLCLLASFLQPDITHDA